MLILNKTKHKRKKFNRFNFLFGVGILILFFVFTFSMYVQASDYYKIKQQYQQAIKERDNAVEENISLVNEYQYKDSDAYIEKVAREQLNMVKPNEIIFIDENK